MVRVCIEVVWCECGGDTFEGKGWINDKTVNWDIGRTGIDWVNANEIKCRDYGVECELRWKVNKTEYLGSRGYKDGE